MMVEINTIYMEQDGLCPEWVRIVLYLIYMIIACSFVHYYGTASCAEYARFLMHKYGNLGKQERKREREISVLIPYGLTYEKQYRNSHRRNRFLFFLWLSRLLIILVYTWVLITLVIFVSELTSGNPLLESFEDKMVTALFSLVIIPDSIAFICALPFNFWRIYAPDWLKGRTFTRWLD